MKQSNSLHVDANSEKLKVDWKFFDWACSMMGVANQFPGLWKWLYLKNEHMELPDYLLAGTNSHKLKCDWKFWGEHVQKWVWSVWW